MSETKLAQFRVDDLLRELANQKLNGERGQHCSLSLTDRAVLMTIANHVRNGSDCYPSQEYLAAYLGTSKETIKRSLRSLKKKKLINSFKKPSLNSRYKTSRHNYYALTLPVDNSVREVIHDPNHDVKGVTDDPCHSVIGVKSTPVIGVTGDPLIEHSNRTIKNKERERKKHALPLSPDFEVSRASCDKAQSLGLTEEEANDELDKFLNYYIEKGEEKTDWNLMLQNWFIRAAQYKTKNKSVKGVNDAPQHITRCTVPDYVTPITEIRGDRNIAAQALGSIMEKLKLNGGKPNGLGSQGKGENKGSS